MKKLLTSVFVIFMVFSLIGGAVGCKGSSSSTTGSASKEATILVGVDTPMTGPAAGYGLAVLHGVQLAADDFNAAGGVTVGNTHYTITLKTLDNKWDDATSNDDVRQLIYQDGVRYLFLFESDTPVSMAPLMSQQKVINFASVANDAVIKQPTNSYTFRTVIPMGLKATPYFNWIKKQYPNVKSVAEISQNNSNGQYANQVCDLGAKAVGWTTTDDILFDGGTTDFQPLLTKVLAKNPDIINMSGGIATGDVALIIKQARGLGYKGLISDAAMASATDMLPIAGKEALEGVLTTNMAMEAPMVGQKVLDLPAREVAKWGQAYGVTWDFYSQAAVLFAAIARAKNADSTVVRDMLADNTQSWPYPATNGGSATFGSSAAKALYGADANHQMLNSFIFGIIKNGVDTNAALINP